MFQKNPYNEISVQIVLVSLLCFSLGCVPVSFPGRAWKQGQDCGRFPPLVQEAINKRSPTIPYSKTRGTTTAEKSDKPLLEYGKHPDLVMIGLENLHSKKYGWTTKIPYGVQTTLFEDDSLILISTAHTFDDNFSILTKFQMIHYLIDKKTGRVLKHLISNASDHYENGILYLLDWPIGAPKVEGNIIVRCFPIN